MIDGGKEEGQGRGGNKGMRFLQRGREKVENQERGMKKDMRAKRRGGKRKKITHDYKNI